jgi:hypothetical protein
MWSQTSSFALAFAVTLLMSASQPQAQTGAGMPTALAGSAPTAVPALVPYSGTALARDGKPLTGESSISFLIFKDEQACSLRPAKTRPKAALDGKSLKRLQLFALPPEGSHVGV